MIVGCYHLALYCDNDNWPDGIHGFQEFPHDYTDEYGSRCRSDARKDGWLLRKDGTALCPKCSGKKPKQ